MAKEQRAGQQRRGYTYGAGEEGSTQTYGIFLLVTAWFYLAHWTVRAYSSRGGSPDKPVCVQPAGHCGPFCPAQVSIAQTCCLKAASTSTVSRVLGPPPRVVKNPMPRGK